MSYTPTEQAAIDRLKTKYNSNAYNPATNPGGFANDGHQVNFPAALADTGNAAAAVGVKADEVGANKIATDTARAAAEQAETNAATHSSNAEAAKTAAETARDVATTRKAEAEAARDIANTRKMEAEAARDAAQLSETNAAAHEAGSLAAKAASEAARDVATTRKTEAEAARDAAATSATASAGSAAASDSFADDAALSSGASANSAAASESSRQLAVTAKNEALAALAAANLPTPIIDDRILMTEGGAYVFKDRAEVMKALGGAAVFDTVYASGTIGAADHGKSYSVDISTVPTVSFDNPGTLPLGWSVTIRATGSPTGFRTAKLSIPAGNFVFRYELTGVSFFLVGNGEAFRVTKILDGTLQLECISQPPSLHVYAYNAGGSAWNSGPTSWFNLSSPTRTGHTFLTDGTESVGLTAASGVYEISGKVYFSVQSGNPKGSAYLQLLIDGNVNEYVWDVIYNEHYSTLNVQNTAYLKQGSRAQVRLLSGASTVFWHPYQGNSDITFRLLGR